METVVSQPIDIPEPVAVADASQQLIALAARVAATEAESGTGKEVLARFIHRQSSRAAQPFVAVNCAAIPETMLESLLFGFERGAFTGAHAGHAGKFEQAQGGTLLLDEISEMPLGLQSKLLRVLQEREVERLGGRGSLVLDVRVIATTNRRLRDEVTAGRFREDLYFRLNVFPLVVLPLRERRDDILPLATQRLVVNTAPGRPIPALSADAAHLLLTYRWPGNVLQRALILVNGTVIEAEHLHFEAPRRESEIYLPGNGRGIDSSALAESLEHREHELILGALRLDGVTRKAVAERLGISPRTLRYKLARMRRVGISVPAA
jgi:two-component system, response regulator FlrC